MSEAARLSLFYAAYFFGAGVQMPFWPVWLAGRGLGPAEIGALLALGQWVRVAANPALGLLADRARDRSRFMVGLGAATFAGYLLCLPAHGFVALILPSLVVACASAALTPLADAATLAAAARGAADYGRVRLWGTLTFIAATLAGGRILAGRSSEWVLYLLLGMAALTAIACAAMPRAAPVVPLRPRANWRLLLAPRHLVFLAAAMLVQSSHAVYYGFGTLYWQRLGFGDGTIALLWAEGAVAEVLLFLVGGRYARRWGPGALLALGGAGGLVRWTATAWVSSLPALLLISAASRPDLRRGASGRDALSRRRGAAGPGGYGAVGLYRGGGWARARACVAARRRALRRLWRQRLSRDGGDGGGRRDAGHADQDRPRVRSSRVETRCVLRLRFAPLRMRTAVQPSSS